MPADRTSPSSGPQNCCAACMPAATEAASATSIVTVATRSGPLPAPARSTWSFAAASAAASRAARTRARSRRGPPASARAVESPMPRLPPVTRIDLAASIGGASNSPGRGKRVRPAGERIPRGPRPVLLVDLLLEVVGLDRVVQALRQLVDRLAEVVGAAQPLRLLVPRGERVEGDVARVAVELDADHVLRVLDEAVHEAAAGEDAEAERSADAGIHVGGAEAGDARPADLARRLLLLRAGRVHHEGEVVAAARDLQVVAQVAVAGEVGHAP